MRGDRLRAVARLEGAEVVRSRWILFCVGLYAALGALFVWVGLRESAVLGFTGMGRALFSLCHALTLVLPLLALLGTGQAVNRARDEGMLELLLAQPLGRSEYLVALTAVRFLAVALPLALLLVGLAALGRLAFGQPVPWAFVARSVAVSVALLWAFAALGIATSVGVRSPARALPYLVLFWAAGVALLDFALIGLLLQWRLEPYAVFALAAANPVEAARLALLAAAEPELATLGPVGFFLANRLGPGALLALGVGWPLLFGAAVWTWALRAFRRGDAV